MIPVSTLYDEYIERRKFTEQKKNPVEYIVPPPSRGSEQKRIAIDDKNAMFYLHASINNFEWYCFDFNMFTGKNI